MLLRGKGLAERLVTSAGGLRRPSLLSLASLPLFSPPPPPTSSARASSSSSSQRKTPAVSASPVSCFDVVISGGDSLFGLTSPLPSLLHCARSFTTPSLASLFIDSSGGLEYLARGHPHTDHSVSACASLRGSWPSAPRVLELPSAHHRGMAEPSRRLGGLGDVHQPLEGAACALSAAKAAIATGGSTASYGSTTSSISSVPSGTSSSPAGTPSKKDSAYGHTSTHGSANTISATTNITTTGKQRFYHFEIRGAENKKTMDPEKIKCMCHEVAAAAALRSRAGSHADANAQRVDFQDNDFCVFTQTVSRGLFSSPPHTRSVPLILMLAYSAGGHRFFFSCLTLILLSGGGSALRAVRDILDAKHSKLSFWGSTHFCTTDDTVTKAGSIGPSELEATPTPRLYLVTIGRNV